MSYCMYNSDPDPGEEVCDIYLYEDVEWHAIVCVLCCMNGFKKVLLKKRSDAIQHIEQHRAEGHRAPYDYIINRLHEEIDKVGDAVKIDEGIHEELHRTAE